MRDLRATLGSMSGLYEGRLDEQLNEGSEDMKETIAAQRKVLERELGQVKAADEKLRAAMIFYRKAMERAEGQVQTAVETVQEATGSLPPGAEQALWGGSTKNRTDCFRWLGAAARRAKKFLASGFGKAPGHGRDGIEVMEEVIEGLEWSEKNVNTFRRR